MYADVRERTVRTLGGLSEAQLLGAPESSLNPMVWVIGHTAHFYEAMVLLRLGRIVALHHRASTSYHMC
jgi:hypothetical protein